MGRERISKFRTPSFEILERLEFYWKLIYEFEHFKRFEEYQMQHQYYYECSLYFKKYKNIITQEYYIFIFRIIFLVRFSDFIIMLLSDLSLKVKNIQKVPV